MNETRTHLADPLYRNWVRGALGLKYLKNGLHGQVDRLIQRHHQSLLQSYITDKGKPAVNCTECTLDNLLPEHPRNCCIHKFRSKCLCSTTAGRRKCPNNFCSHFYDLMVLAHDERNPNLLNTDPSRWYSDHWSFAQCFIATGGYADKTSAAETDAAGLLTIILNNIDIKGRIDNIDNFIQARQDRNDIMHSTDFEVLDVKLLSYIDRMIKVLQDSTLLSHEQEAKIAVEELKKLKANKLTITTQDITGVLEDVIAQNTRRAREEIEETKQETIKTCIERLENMKTSVSGIESNLITSAAKLKEDVVQEIKDAALNVQQHYQQSMVEDTTRQEDHFKAFATRQEESMVTRAKRQLDQHSEIHEERLVKRTKELEQEMEDKCQLRSTVSSNKNMLAEAALSPTSYEKMKEDLKTDLIAFYQTQHRTLPLSPLLEEHDATLTDFYVTPTLLFLNKVSGIYWNKIVSSYSDIFPKQLGKSSNIYLTSPAGTGKTAFTKRMALTWCQAKNPVERERIYFSNFDADIDVMKSFSYLFLIVLRDVGKDHFDIESMIKTEILDQLAGQYTSEFMTRLLREENILIILDGLDEWAHPTAEFSSCNKISGIPHRKVTEHCSFLTTTRSWKLDTLRLSSSQIDREFEITQLNDDMASELSNKFTKHLNCMNNENRSHGDFESLIQKKSLGKLHHIPLILMQLLCLWYDRQPIGKSLCQIYANMVEFLINRAVQKSTRIDKCLTDSQRETLPNCFGNATNCRKYKHFLVSIGKLAFEQFVSKDRCSSLVFDSSAVKNVISEDVLTFALETGILTKTKVNEKRLTSRLSSLSFIHKTYQEFFTALYISVEHISSFKIITSETTVASLLDMWNVLDFLCGLNEINVYELASAIHGAISRDDCTLMHRKSCDRYASCKLTMKRLQDMMIECLEENKSCGGEGVFLPLTDVFIFGHRHSTEISEYIALLKNLMNINMRKLKSVQLACSTQILVYLREELASVQNLQSIFCTSRNLESILPSMISRSYKTLNVLDIVQCPITESLLTAIASLKNLEVLSLEDTPITKEEIINALYKNISVRSNLKHLRLVETNKLLYAIKPCLDLTKLRQLETLHLEDRSIEIVEFPLDFPSVQTLKCNYDLPAYRPIRMTKLVELDLHSCGSLTQVNSNTIINKFSSIQILKLKNLHLQDSLDIPENIKYVELSFVKMNDFCFHHFVLQFIRKDTEVKMVDCRIIPIFEIISKKYEQIVGELRDVPTCVILKEDVKEDNKEARIFLLHFQNRYERQVCINMDPMPVLTLERENNREENRNILVREDRSENETPKHICTFL